MKKSSKKLAAIVLAVVMVLGVVTVVTGDSASARVIDPPLPTNGK